jgi:spermidine/putrescine transport system ATP-binding protein
LNSADGAPAGSPGSGPPGPSGVDGADVVLRDLVKRYGDVRAVDGVSLEIRRGEFFSLLGPSGCGKTTTLRIIGGFELPTRGEVWLRGRLVNDVPPYRRATNMVFQQLALFPHLSVFDNVGFGLRLRRLPGGETRRRVEAALALVDLGGLHHRQIYQLSGGQKQRVAIARALVNEPAVLLLDEPLGALDLKLRLAMQAELKALQHRVGTTFVYVTHDQGEALTMSDRIGVMRDGRLEQVGSSYEIYAKPRTRFVATFIGEANLLEGRVGGPGPDGTVRVAAGPLSILATAAGEVAPGSPVTLSIRPEHIKLGPPAAGLANRFPGRVQDTVFMGSIVRCRVRLAEGVVVTTECHNDAAGALHPEAAVQVGWGREYAVVLQG